MAGMVNFLAILSAPVLPDGLQF